MQTTNGIQAVTTRARNIAPDGFEAALFEEEALMNGHLTESVGYLAIESPSNGGLVSLGGRELPYLLQNTKLNWLWAPVLSRRIKLEEEQSMDAEIQHVDEAVDVLALGQQIFAQQVSNNDGDTAALRLLPPTQDAPMEWGLVRGIDHNWQTLPFAKSYKHPVVIAKPVSNRDGDGGVIRLRDVTAGRVQLRYQEWGDYLDGLHGVPEDIFYLVSEAGEHSLAGLSVDAGTLVTNRLGRADQWQKVAFDTTFPYAPVVLSSVMTYNGTHSVITRIDNLGDSGMVIAMDEQESKNDGHLFETLGWIAIEQGSGETGEGAKVDAFSMLLRSDFDPVTYPRISTHRFPSVFADVNSSWEMDPVFLRYDSLGKREIELGLTEDQSLDSEVSHVQENVGVVIAE